LRQVELEPRRHLGRAQDGVAVVREELEHLCRRSQDALPVAAPLDLARLERGVVMDRDEDVLKRCAAQGVGMDVAGDHRLHSHMCGEIAQEPVPARIAALERPLQLDEEALRPEDAGQLRSRVRVVETESLPRTARKTHEPLVQVCEQVRVECGRQ
jgi:hypothetical protein